MVEDGEEQRGSEARRRTDDLEDCFSISINTQLLQAIDEEVEDGLWDNRSQAISHYVNLGIEVDDQTRKLAIQRVLMFDALSKADAADREFIITVLSFIENLEFRRWMKKQMEDGLGQK